ncbi:MAG: hypothetical protein HPY66_2328 [Firmicutes bacterium]|nr:hypothetical protein [Bacillota bacterium]MDI6705717.1 FadR/GntR family transcriptional regulator [Bacillota bacterium]
MFIPVKSKKMYMLVAEQIESLIKEGKIKAGDRLPSERDMASQFGISRATIREALTALEMQGLIESRTGSGTFVCEKPESWETGDIILEDMDKGISPFELFEARIVIEPDLARLAAQRSTNEEIEELSAILKRAEALSDEDYIGYENIDREFHLMIAKIADNEVLLKIEESINNERMGVLWGNLKRKSLQQHGRIQQYKTDHRNIFDAIRERNPGKAEREMRKHLLTVKQNIFGE